MVVSHLTGRGAAELVRFWESQPLVREPDLALFGVDRMDPAEQRACFQQSPVRCYLAEEVQRAGVASAAKTAIDRIHGHGAPFVLHLDVAAIPDFQATEQSGGTGGLSLEEVREALGNFSRNRIIWQQSKWWATIRRRDPDATGAKLILRAGRGRTTRSI